MIYTGAHENEFTAGAAPTHGAAAAERKKASAGSQSSFWHCQNPTNPTHQPADPALEISLSWTPGPDTAVFSC